MLRKFLPIAGILGLVLLISGPVAAVVLMQGYNSERASAAREIIVRVSMINNEIQRERDFVSTFRYARVQEDGEPRDMAATDDYRALLLPEIESLTIDGAPLDNYHTNLSRIAPALDRLSAIRANAVSEESDSLATFVAYSDVISELQDATLDLYRELNLPRSHRNLETKLVWLTERLARERGYGLMAIAEVAPPLDLTRARQSNLAALDQLQEELRSLNNSDSITDALSPLVSDLPVLEEKWAQANAETDGAAATEAAHDWFASMSEQIDAVRLLHTRLLAGPASNGAS
tara:strand:- start:318 stop:1187 length:870 start_codon:yes stop_codon:yes gene_type:complete